jgi:selenocysteine lyase/cysteine desulfurase
MMTLQKYLFQLPEEIHYLNGAYMSPLMQIVEEAGIMGMQRKRNPFTIKPIDFFLDAEEVRIRFGKIVNCKPAQVAIIPAVSYGLKTAIANIPTNNGSHAIVVSDEFPSGYYPISEWCKTNDKDLKVINAPESLVDRGKKWNENLLNSIDNETCAVVLSSVHWTDGTKFDLKKIGAKCKATNTLFIVDGSQSVGVLPIDVNDFQIDALICVGYKWLLGPYNTGIAYYSEFYDHAKPIEDVWINKLGAEDFTKLTNYVDEFKPGASKFNVGESGNLIQLPMMIQALDQILEWKVQSIQDYAGELIQLLLQFLRANQFWVEDDEYRCNHIVGFLLPKTIDRAQLLQKLQANNVIVSVRGEAIRVSAHVYNTKEDIQALINVLKDSI